MGTFISVAAILVAILATLKENKTVRGILAWSAAVIATLIFPTVLIIFLVIQISARLFAPTSNDVAEFVSQIAWLAGVFGSVYSLIWGVKFYHRLANWVSGFISSPEAGKEKEATEEKPGVTLK